MADAIAGAAGSNPVMKKMPAKRGDPLAGGPPAGQEGKAAELAAALFLAGDGSSSVDVVDLPVDGGLAATGIHAFARDKMDVLEDVMGGRNPAMAAIMDGMKR